MLNDVARNRAFAMALKSILDPKIGQLSVLDLGSGTGLLGIAADTIGSRQVVCVEFNDPIAQLSRLAIEANEVNIDLHTCLSTDFYPHNKFDVLITEIFDCALLGEDAIRSILDAKQRLIKPNGKIIPKCARIYCQALYSDQMRRKSFKKFSPTCTIGSYYTSRLKPNRGNGDEPYEGERVGDLRDLDLSTLTERQLLMDCNFTSMQQMDRIVNFPATKTVIFKSENHLINMIILTFELDLDDNITINNAIGTPGCWEQAVYPLREEIMGEVRATFRLECDSPVLIHVEHESIKKIPEPTVFVSERLIYLFNEPEREDQVAGLFTREDFVIFYTTVPDFDVIYESIKSQKKLFIVGCDGDTTSINTFVNSISIPSKVTVSRHWLNIISGFRKKISV